jgi:hypothetical protein
LLSQCSGSEITARVVKFKAQVNARNFAQCATSPTIETVVILGDVTGTACSADKLWEMLVAEERALFA